VATDPPPVPPDLARNLRPAYRWCLRAYPRSYLREHGDDLIWLITDLHAGERRVSVRECMSIVRSGMVRRVKLTGRYVFPMLLFVEALFVPLVLGSVIKGALGQRPFLTFTSLGFVRDQMHFETAWFVVFAAALLVVASVLGWAGVRAVRDAPPSRRGRRRLPSVDDAGVLVQPLALVALGATTVGTSDASDAASAVVIAVGCVLALLILRYWMNNGGLSRARLTAAVASAVILAGLVGLSAEISASSPGQTDFTSQEAVATGRLFPSAVSCPSPTRCFAFGSVNAVVLGRNSIGALAVAESSGDNWHLAPARVDAGGLFSALVCPTSLECFLTGVGGGPWAGRIARTTNGGASWDYVQESGAVIDSLACPSAVECVVVGAEDVSVTHDAGTSWATTLRLSRYALPSEALSCPSTSDCYFVTLGPVSPEQPQSGLSFSVYSTTDGGRSWHGHTLLDNSPGGISNVVCRTALQCLVTAGGTWWATVNGGDTWTEHAPPVGLPTGVTASCSYAMACWALVGAPASSMVSSRDGGGRWQRVGTFPPGFRGFESACVNELDCTVIGGTYPHGILEAQIVTTTDGGRSWALTPFPELPSRWLPRPVSIG